MGRRLAEATKASRMRRTRGERGRLRFLAAARVGAGAFFTAAFGEGFEVAGFGGDFSGAVWSEDDLSGAGDAACACVEAKGVSDCRANAADEPAPFGSMNSAPRTSNHHCLRPNRPTFYFRAETRMP